VCWCIPKACISRRMLPLTLSPLLRHWVWSHLQPFLLTYPEADLAYYFQLELKIHTGRVIALLIGLLAWKIISIKQINVLYYLMHKKFRQIICLQHCCLVFQLDSTNIIAFWVRTLSTFVLEFNFIWFEMWLLKCLLHNFFL